MKILVIDDEPIVRESCERILAPEGFEALFAPIAKEAFHLLGEFEVTLGIIDITVHERDGFFLVDEGIDKGKETPMIVVRGYHIAETDEEAMGLESWEIHTNQDTPVHKWL